jgi:hypothetical protein
VHIKSSTRCNTSILVFIARPLYMFRVFFAPIIRNTINCSLLPLVQHTATYNIFHIEIRNSKCSLSLLVTFQIQYIFWGVFPWRQIKFCRRLGTLSQVHLQRLDEEYEWREESVVFIYTVSGLARDCRINGGGEYQVLGRLKCMGGCGGVV